MQARHKSDRAIAAELGVSDRTVNRARATYDAPDGPRNAHYMGGRLGANFNLLNEPTDRERSKEKHSDN
jgi:hypothetical protein